MKRVSIWLASCWIAAALAITPALAQGTKQKGAIPKPATGGIDTGGGRGGGAGRSNDRGQSRVGRFPFGELRDE